MLVLLLSPVSELEHAPLPLKCYKPGDVPQLLFLSLFSPWTRSLVQKGAWGCARVTICFDGWDNIVKCPLLNMTFTCTSGNVFLCAINIVKEHKDAHYKCNTLVGYIETIKVDNIQNVLNMQNVIDLLIHCFLNLYFQGSVIYCLDAIGRLGKKTCMKQFVTRRWGLRSWFVSSFACRGVCPISMWKNHV